MPHCSMVSKFHRMSSSRNGNLHAAQVSGLSASRRQAVGNVSPGKTALGSTAGIEVGLSFVDPAASVGEIKRFSTIEIIHTAMSIYRFKFR